MITLYAFFILYFIYKQIILLKNLYIHIQFAGFKVDALLLWRKFQCSRTHIGGARLTPCILNMLFILALKYILLILHVSIT